MTSFPHRVESGVSERRWKAWRWRNRFLFKRYIEDHATFVKRKIAHDRWRRAT